ncbi:MAG: hypothetical protein QOD11_23 [Bradyrhizobium sp.]|nr:hypothetical protein [Bradyrhizobium sp.]
MTLGSHGALRLVRCGRKICSDSLLEFLSFRDHHLPHDPDAELRIACRNHRGCSYQLPWRIFYAEKSQSQGRQSGRQQISNWIDSAAALPAMTTHKKACRHLRRQAVCVCRKIPQTYSTQRLLLLMAQTRGQETTSAVTRPTPAPVRPTARAAPVERSRTRPRINGPRSLMVTTTLRPPWVTRSLVPNGRLR